MSSARRNARSTIGRHRRADGRARIFPHASHSRAAWTRIHRRGQRESDGRIRRQRDVRPELPLGTRSAADVHFRPDDGRESALPIIGVVGDVSEGSVRVAPQPTVFYSHGRMPWATMTLFVRGRQPESLVKPVTAALHDLDPTLVVSNVRTIERAGRESGARTHQRAHLDELRRRRSAAGGARTLRFARLSRR